jgi:LysM repeat protein
MLALQKSMNLMNTSNPFQIPACLQRADSEQRRRERFKKGFIAGVAVVVILLVGLLIEGCMSEKATTPAPAPKVAEVSAPQPGQTLVVQKPNPCPQPNLNATTRPAPSSSATVAATASHSETVYVVKSGDTLTRIAKAHGTTIKALRAANSLEGDRLLVGEKLKMPEA